MYRAFGSGQRQEFFGWGRKVGGCALFQRTIGSFQQIEENQPQSIFISIEWWLLFNSPDANLPVHTELHIRKNVRKAFGLWAKGTRKDIIMNKL